MINNYIFLRHGETVKDPSKPSTEWTLTTDALLKVEGYLEEKIFDSVTKIFSSTEHKSISTAMPILKYYQDRNISLQTMEEFVEVKRENKFLTDEEFQDQKRRELANLDKIENGKESGLEALTRFEDGIKKLEEKYSDKNNPETILIISHGTILALYISKQRNNLQNAYDFWKTISFCDILKK